MKNSWGCVGIEGILGQGISWVQYYVSVGQPRVMGV